MILTPFSLTDDGGGGVVNSEAVPLVITDYGGERGAIKNSEGVWNAAEAPDNVAALKRMVDDAVAKGRSDVLIPAGDWAFGFKTPGASSVPILELANASGIRIRGVGWDTNIVFLSSIRRQGIVVGGSTCFVPTESTTVQLTAPTSVDNLVLSVNSTTNLRDGMHIVLADPAQPVPSLGAVFDNTPASTMYCLHSYAQIRQVIDATHILIGGTLPHDFTTGTKVGYLNAPVVGAAVSDMRFTYCPVNSPQGGAFSAMSGIGTVGFSMERLWSDKATSRCFAVKRGRDYLIRDVHGLETHQELGSLFTASNSACHGLMDGCSSVSGTHLFDGGGGILSPASHWRVKNFRAREAGGSAVGCHKSCFETDFEDGYIEGIDREISLDPNVDAGDKGTALVCRGAKMRVKRVKIKRAPIAFRGWKAKEITFEDCEAEGCGRSAWIDNCSDVTINNFKSRDALFYAIDSYFSVGPAQNHEPIKNIRYSNIQTLGSEPLADMLIRTAGVYTKEVQDREGWRFEVFGRNGGVARITGTGTSSGLYPTRTPSPSLERARQLTGPAFQITPSTGAVSMTVDSIAGVTKSYTAGERFPVPGGTLAAGGLPAIGRVERVTIKSLDIKYGGRNNIVGETKEMAGGMAVVRATYQVDEIGTGGVMTAGTLLTGGIYDLAPTEFGQFSSSDDGKNTFITTVDVVDGGDGHAVDDELIAQGGSVTRAPAPPDDDGEKNWPRLKVATVGPDGIILTAIVLEGGEFLSLPASGGLAQNFTTGSGSKATFVITGSTSRNAEWENAVLAPYVVSVASPGKNYSVTPTNPVTPVSESAAGGEGATINVVWGTVADLGESPKEQVEFIGGPGTIDSLGARRGGTYMFTSLGAWTLAQSSLLELQNGGASIVMASGASGIAKSNFSNPVGWRVQSYATADGRPLQQYLASQAAPATTLTNGALLTKAQIRTGYITVNAADDAADDYQLPTVTNMNSEFTEIAIDKYFDFTIANGNANSAATATVTTFTGWTLGVNMVVAAKSSGRFRAYRTGTSTWTLLRLS